MARIKINDLPKDMKISKEDMRRITGGGLIMEDKQILQDYVQIESRNQTLGSVPVGLAPGHAYTVIGTTSVDGEEYVVQRNPWG